MNLDLFPLKRYRIASSSFYDWPVLYGPYNTGNTGILIPRKVQIIHNPWDFKLKLFTRNCAYPAVRFESGSTGLKLIQPNLSFGRFRFRFVIFSCEWYRDRFFTNSSFWDFLDLILRRYSVENFVRAFVISKFPILPRTNTNTIRKSTFWKRIWADVEASSFESLTSRWTSG